MCKICKQLITSPAIWSSVDIVPMLLPGWGVSSGSLRCAPVPLIAPRKQPGPLPGEEVRAQALIHAGVSFGHGAIVTLPALQIIPIWPHAPKASAIARGRHTRACPFLVRQIFLLNISSFSVKSNHPFVLIGSSSYPICMILIIYIINSIA